ncbi:protein TonB-like [Poecilia reticulata]|uniref:protein TonB-like n=1 Tax=Poecilia reticulata TaxID=8081 RepID=UPI0007EBD26D|nr:PREDICTED: protein TonB-like [Poecilia reticulata]
MLSWVVKVVPQPPELPSKNTEDAKEGKPEAAPPPAPEKKVTFEDECKKDAAKADKLNQEVESSAGNGPAPGMLTWISSALPLPAPPANQNQASSTAKEEAAASKPDDE